VESLNFDMSTKQLKSLQSFLDTQIRSQLVTLTNKGGNEDDWFLRILESVSDRMIGEDKSEFKDKREILKEEPITKSLVNENYIICPSPIAIAWNPQGQLTISEHKSIPRIKGSYMGTRKFLNFALESSKTNILPNSTKE
jgi:hypothetical protein